ncbi:MAG: hydrolase [Gammaproteobacteria bacterium]|nr:MAG: hydrolase [Gammaproteobacteria bacterium]
MLVSAEQSCLLVIDVQEKLMPVIHDRERVERNCAWLIDVAREVNVPVLVSEQYPRGLGHTVGNVKAHARDEEVMEKLYFSCVSEPACQSRLDDLGREQVVVAGVEAHVCVLQTVLELCATGREVFLCADAVSSRDPRNAELAIERMRTAGAHIVAREMVAFEWLRRAGTAEFKEISCTYLRDA